MSAAEAERTHAADDSDEHFGRYLDVVVPLAGAPLIIVWALRHFQKFDQLSLVLQALLVVLAFLGAVLMIWLLLLRSGRSYWARPSRGNWWGFFVISTPAYRSMESPQFRTVRSRHFAWDYLLSGGLDQ